MPGENGFSSITARGASPERARPGFPARACGQQPAAVLSVPKDASAESTDLGWKWQQLLYAGICGIPAFQALSACRNSALGHSRHRSVVNNCST